MECKRLSQLKVPLLYSGVIVADECLYVVGGCNKNGVAQNTVQMLNIDKNDGFTQLNDLPRVKAGTSLIHSDKKVISIGGIYNKGCPLEYVDIFDTVEQSWTLGPTLPCALQNTKCIMHEEEILCIGGMTTNSQSKSSLLKWDPRETNSHWTSLPDMSSARFSPGVFIYKEQLYVLGGRDKKSSCNACECFDFRANSWRTIDPLPVEYRHVFSGCVSSGNEGSHVYIMGGLCEDPKEGFTGLTFFMDLETEKWTKVGNMLKPRGDFGLFSYDNCLVACGGFGSGQTVPTSIEVYSESKKRWSLEETDLPDVHASASSFADDRSRLFMVGGMGAGGPSHKVSMVTAAAAT